MRIKLIAVAAAMGLMLSGCMVTEAEVEAREAYYEDKPAAVTCYTYGERTFDGFSKGKVIYDEGGRLTFVDKANDRLTTIEGDCRVVYAGDL